MGEREISLVLANVGGILVTLIFGTQDFTAAAAIAFARQRLGIQ